MNKPKALKRGDRVAIVSLSDGMLGEDFCRHNINIGRKRLTEFGFEPVFMPHSLKGIEYLNNHPEDRASDLKAAFMDDSIKGIICAIGGDDTYRILPYLLEDKIFVENVKNNSKLFTGFSDTTVNHFMFYKLGMTSFYGPNFICDLGEIGREMLPYTKAAFEGYIKGHKKEQIVSSEVWYEERTDFSADAIGSERICHKEMRGYELLQGEGKFSGRLLGGCLESIYNMISGVRYEEEKIICEKYELFPKKEEWKEKILFLETCEEKPTPELLNIELTALKEKGVFDEVNGIIVGKPQDEEFYEEYKNVYTDVIHNEKLPILYNVNFGHALPRCALPYGVKAGVDMEEKKIMLLENSFLE